ncbi:hypothetical protein SELMODRAFT_88682 [Selaginella moellendorffii]|uniref:ubiquitinyl hydrolase 1 n=1 Tax=Selaginella moellendorffii TaxID=88036 RepID=D8R952_SELML|nr:hypothetical protein SELMODRAFT_88682 [Selaginella moellendorffii]
MLVRALPQWIRGSHGAHQRELTVPGLQNSGNNCFLNAILQALASSQKFAAYLRAYENLEGDEREPSMPLSSALCELLEELGEVAPGHRIVSPRQVMRVLGHYARSFDLGMQQDAAEALSYLAAALQHERMENFEEYRPTLQSLADVSALSRQMESLIHTDDFQSKLALNYWRQQLRWPMEGTYGSSIICSQCGFQRKACTIEDCLDQFTMLERVSNFKCSRCAHLAAACFLSRRPEDNKDHISFSTTLDLSPFTIASKQTPTRKDSAEIDPRVFKTAMLPVLRALGSTGLKLYDLISVVVHQGSPMSGHYTVYRKVKETKQGDVKIAREETMWFAISDADVVKVSEEEVLEARATLLFYELH